MTLRYCGKCGTPNGSKALFCRQCGIEINNQVTDTAIDDPISISRSLKRVRASGSLIIEASKKKREDIDSIISQALESFTETKPVGNDVKEERHEEKDTGRLSAIPGNLNNQIGPVGNQSSMNPGNTGSLIVRNPSTGIIAPLKSRPDTGPLTLPSQPPHYDITGPSKVLAQASGLNRRTRFGVKFYLGILTGVSVLGIVTYFGFRDSLLSGRLYAASERNLVRVEDQSSEFFLRGEKERKNGNLEGAIDFFKKSSELTPNDSKVRMAIAQVKSQQGKVDDAIREYKNILRISPEHLDARLLMANLLKLKGNKLAAYQEYQRIIALDQYSSQSITALAEIESLQKSHLFDNAVNKDKKSKSGKNGLVLNSDIFALKLPSGLSLNPVKQPSILSTPAKSSPDANPESIIIADAHKKLGLRYLNVNEYRAAINEFLAALKTTPDDKDIYYFLGSAHYGLGNHATAHDYYRRVDKGSYVQVAQSGAQRTEKAYREDLKRRLDIRN